MYTRTYYTDDKKIDIPDNYDGNAFEKSTPVFEAASVQAAEEVRSDQSEKEDDLHGVQHVKIHEKINDALSKLGKVERQKPHIHRKASCLTFCARARINISTTLLYRISAEKESVLHLFPLDFYEFSKNNFIVTVFNADAGAISPHFILLIAP